MYTKWLIVAALAIGIGIHHTPGAHAQTHNGAAHKQTMNDRDIEKIAKMIDATPAQVQQFKVLHSRFEKRADEIKNRKGATPEQVKKEMEVLHNDIHNSLKKILSPGQLKKLEEHHAAFGKAGAGKSMNPMDILPKLDLSDAQMVQVKQIMARTHEAIDQIKKHPNLSDAQKKAQMEQLHHQGLEQIHGILTPEQSKKAHEIWSKHQQGGVKNPPPAGG